MYAGLRVDWLKVRPLWRSYTRTADGILFVIDSSDVERLDEARLELQRAAREPETLGVPIVVVANKSDLRSSVGEAELQRLLGLADMLAGRPWCVQAACAVTGEGLDDVLVELHEMIVKRRKSRRTRVSTFDLTH